MREWCVARQWLIALLFVSVTFACSPLPQGELLPTLVPTADALIFVSSTPVVPAVAAVPGTFTPAAVAPEAGPIFGVVDTPTFIPGREENRPVPTSTPIPPTATPTVPTSVPLPTRPLLPSSTPLLIPTITPDGPPTAPAPVVPTNTPRPAVPTNTPRPPTATNTVPAPTMIPTIIAPTNTAGPPPPTPSDAWPAPTAHPFPISSEPRQGWAAVLNGSNPVDDTTLGQWQYAYGPFMRFSLTNLQHIPMLISEPSNGMPGTPFIIEMDGRSPHDYWIVYNECEHQDQCNTSPQAAADFYHDQILDVLYTQGADANARLILGGVNAHPCGIDWLEQFVTYYEATYGELPRAGWHFHIYPDVVPDSWPGGCGGNWIFDDRLFPDPQTAFNLWLSQARSTLEFVQQYGKSTDEIWFTELGCLNGGYHQQQRLVCSAPGFMAGYVPPILEWLNNEGRWVTRYAWYTDWDSNYWNYTKLYKTVEGETNRELNSLGLFYSQVDAAQAIPLPWNENQE